MRTQALLGGIPLTSWAEPSWEMRYGSTPVTVDLDLPVATADAVLQVAGFGSEAQPLILEVLPEDRPALLVQLLYAFDRGPGRDKEHRTVRVADRRVWWPEIGIARDYNLRKFADVNLVLGARPENALFQPDVKYKRSTLRNGLSPWTAVEILEDLLRRITAEDTPGITAPLFNVDIPLQSSSLVVEDLSIYDQAEAAIDRALEKLVGSRLFVDTLGTVQVVSELDQSEEALAESAGVPHYFSGWRRKVDKSHLRPSRVRVLISREPELRFDFTEGPVSIGEQGREDLVMENVVMVPDPSLTLVSGEVVGQGSIVPIQDALDAWNADTAAPAPFTLTLTKLREHATSSLSRLATRFAGETAGSAAVWIPRLKALNRDWRRLFRVIPAWVDRIRYFKAVRASLVNRETGQQGLAEAFFDYMVRPTWRGLSKDTSQRADHGWVIEAHATLLEDAKVSPARVIVQDSANGIIRVVPQIDPFGEADQILPGKPDDEQATQALAGLNLKTWDNPVGIGGLWNSITVSDNFKLSVVLTVGQGAPNGLKRLHQEIVTPEQAGSTMGITVGPSFGPEATILVNPSLITARFGWDDGQAALIREAFYTGDIAAVGPGAGAIVGIPSFLMVNPDHVRNVALAVAAKHYSSRLDGVEGGFEVALNPDAPIRPSGSASSVRHTLRRDGALVTRVSLPPRRGAVDLWPWLPASTRRVILNTVQP